MKKIQILAASLFIGGTLLSANQIKVENFLEKALKQNPQLSHIKVTVEDSKQIKGLKGWKMQNIRITADAKEGNKIRKVNESSTFFTNGRFLVDNMTDMLTGDKITLEKKFPKKFYDENHLISGSSDSKNKVVIFSDPLCPFCRKLVPKKIRLMKKFPKEFAVYYFDLPLENLHPASKTIVKINEALRERAKNAQATDYILEMYDFEINPGEKNEEKILKAYNEQFGYDLTLKEINKKSVLKNIKKSEDVASNMSVSGTPTFYYNGENNKGGTKIKHSAN